MTYNELSSLEALLSCQIKLTERHGQEEIKISVARAREILHQVIIAQKILQATIRKQPSYFDHLDAMHKK